MLGKVVVILLIAAIFYMILAGKCSAGSGIQRYMPYLPSKEMCDMVPEYWPEVCGGDEYGHVTKREDVLRASKEPLREKCCGAGISSARMQSKLKEKCCGAV